MNKINHFTSAFSSPLPDVTVSTETEFVMTRYVFEEPEFASGPTRTGIEGARVPTLAGCTAGGGQKCTVFPRTRLKIDVGKGRGSVPSPDGSARMSYFKDLTITFTTKANREFLKCFQNVR